MVRILAIASLLPCAAGHGGIVHPPARNEVVMLWFNEGCQIGCDECKGHRNAAVSAIIPYCKHSMQPTLTDPELVTYPGVQDSSIFKYNPWYAPGAAPMYSPCGLAAGQSGGSYPANGDVPPPGYAPGFDGRNLGKSKPVEWTVGSIQEVSWSIAANHGGGYAVRLCPASSDLTEECFQQHHLPFEGASSWIQFGATQTDRTEIRANRTTSGTFPKGSQWTKVPIPSCGGMYGGGLGCDAGCDQPQFPSPIPGLWGNGPSNGCAGCDKDNKTHSAEICAKVMDFQIVDKVKVPDFAPGDYVLSFRWDCEQTAQIWSQCSDVRITAPSVLV
jgi:hypothetical protein